jgi:hypothetical protein
LEKFKTWYLGNHPRGQGRASKLGLTFFSPKPVVLYTARKSAKSDVGWYQNYENQLTGSKVMAF